MKVLQVNYRMSITTRVLILDYFQDITPVE